MRWSGRARSVQHTQTGQLGNVLPAVPRAQGGPLVAAHQEVKLCRGLSRLSRQGLQRVYGVAGPCALELTLIDHHARQALKSELGHGQAVNGGAEGAQLVPGVARGQDAQLVQPQLGQCRTRQVHMRPVRRVKGAAKHPHAARPQRLRQTQSLATKKSRSSRPSGESGMSSRR